MTNALRQQAVDAQMRSAHAFSIEHGLSAEMAGQLMDEVEAILVRGETPTIGLYRRYLGAGS